MLSILALMAAVAGSSVQRKAWIDPESRAFRDLQGRHVIMHGVNVVYKEAPYIPIQDHEDSELSLTDEDIDDLKSWGFNLVRLGVMWEAVETAPGEFNQTFLTRIDKLITKLGEKGIYTLLDMHQDVMSRPVCGEGMPYFYAQEILDQGTYCFGQVADWFLKPVLKHLGVCKSIKEYGYKTDDKGLPLISECKKVMFAAYYTSPEALTLFRALYRNDYGITDKFYTYWQTVADRIGQNPYIVGFDPLNEPLPSWNNLLNLLSVLFTNGFYDMHDLNPIYENLFKNFQQVHTDLPMWFEPGQLPDWLTIRIFGIQLVEKVRPLGFPVPPGGQINSNMHVLNDHTYCCQLGPNVCVETGEPPEDLAGACRTWHAKRFKIRDQDAKKFGIPFMLSEFGACSNSVSCHTEMSQILDQSDLHVTAGWAYWQFKSYKDFTTSSTTTGFTPEGFYNEDGSLQNEKVRILARPYISAAQGTTTSMLYDNDRIFHASVEVDTSVDAPTIVYLYRDGKGDPLYGDGVEFRLSGAAGLDAETEANLVGNELQIMVKNPEMKGQELHITVTPKAKEESMELIQ